MFPCVCSVRDHRWRQNVVKQWSGARAARECVTDVCHILTSSVIYYWTNPRQRGIYLFYTMIRKVQRPIHTYLHRTAWLFEDLCKFRHFFNPKRYVSSRLFLSFFILLVYSSWKSLNVFTCSKQNNGENILQSSKSISICRSDGWWWQLLWRFLAV